MNWRDISYKELSSWVSVSIIAGVLVYYLTNMVQLDHSSMLTSDDHNQLLLVVVLITVVTQVIFQSVAAGLKHLDADAQPDERDQWFTFKASFVSNNFICFFMVMLILFVSQSEWLFDPQKLAWKGLAPKDMLLSVLVVGFGLSQLLNHLTLAILYRKGA